MARSGLYKSDVQRARQSLLAQGQRPSVDAVRIALGNTGSKTTIHRLLKEIEGEEAQPVGTKAAVSDALQDLVNRLAARLHEEATALIDEARERFEGQLQDRNQALEKKQSESTGLSVQLQRVETALVAEQQAHAAAEHALIEARATIRQLEERIAGLITRVGEHEAHARSLEEKHQHAREALEHYRTSVREQREQEQRRHEQQLQELQVALRQANESLTAKNHEILQLTRDNVRWLELNGRQEQDLKSVHSKVELQQAELDALRLTATEYSALQARWADDTRALQTLQTQLQGADEATLRETERRRDAEARASSAEVRLETVQALLDRLTSQHGIDRHT